MEKLHTITEDQIWELLQTVPDPEVPVISVVELGIIQRVEVEESGAVRIAMTPTFAGCPAVEMMQNDMRTALESANISDVQIEIVYDPAWTSDRITEEGRRKLKAFGLAPPPPLLGRSDGSMILLVEQIECPFCESKQTRLESPFGPTLCRAIYYCNSCKQSFELFKPL